MFRSKRGVLEYLFGPYTVLWRRRDAHFTKCGGEESEVGEEVRVCDWIAKVSKSGLRWKREKRGKLGF